MKKLFILLILLLIVGLGINHLPNLYLPSKKAIVQPPIQLPALPENLICDEKGLPCFIFNGKKIYNPASVIGIIYSKVTSDVLRQKALDFMENRLLKVSGSRGTAELVLYDYDYVYNYNKIPAGFTSAYAQHVWLQASLWLHQRDSSQINLQRVKKAVAAFFIPESAGGFATINKDGDLWFEEIPNTHILNGHVASINSLTEANQILHDPSITALIDDAIASLEKRLFLYNGGSECRYDLIWNPYEILFTLTSSGNNSDPLLLIREITARHGNENYPTHFLKKTAWQGNCRLAGYWEKPINKYDYRGRYLFSPEQLKKDQRDPYDLNRKPLFFLEFPLVSETDYCAENNPEIIIDCLDLAAGTIELQLRDPAFPDRYLFRKIASTRTYGTKKSRQICFTVDRRVLSLPTGKYREVHRQQFSELLEHHQSKTIEIFLQKLQKEEILREKELALQNHCDQIIPLNRQSLNWPDATSKLEGKTLATLAADGDINTFFYSPWDHFPQTLEVRFSSPVLLSGVEMDFYSKSVAPKKFSLHFPQQVLQRENLERILPWHREKFPSPIFTDRVDVVFRECWEQNRVLIRELRFLGDIEYPCLRSLVKSLTSLNSLPENKTPDLETILALGMELKKRYELGFPTGSTLCELIKGPVLQCGERVKILSALLWYYDIASRPINLYNYPEPGAGHSVMEFFYEGQWRYYDPSYTFFISKNQSPLQLASFAEIKKNPELAGEFGRHGTGEIWLLEERPGLFHTQNHPYNMARSNTEPACFEFAEPAGVVDSIRPIFFPVIINEVGRSIGKVDEIAGANSHQDCDSGFVKGIPAGLSYIGASMEKRHISFLFTKGYGQTWSVRLTPAYVSDKDITVSLSCAGGEVIGPESWNPGFVGFRNNQKQVYEFKFVSLYDSATLQINPQVSQRVSYINLDAIEISLDKD